MSRNLCYLCFLWLALFVSCDSSINKPPKTRTDQSKIAGKPPGLNFNYSITPPDGWTIKDSIMSGLRVKMIQAPDTLIEDLPAINILVALMGDRQIDEFLEKNMITLEQKGKGTVLLKKGSIDISSINSRWFTYTSTMNGRKRDVINYIIPDQGFAYMITCGVKAGRMVKYRQLFERTAKSFRLNPDDQSQDN